MQSRNVLCRPSVYRIAKQAGPCASRNMSVFAPSPYVPRFPSGGDFLPLFRLLDDFTSSSSSFGGFPTAATHRHARRAFQPRFDVKEVEGGYELRGELPGVEASDIEVAFTDDQTLVIKGHTERESTSGTASTAQQPTAVAEETNAADTARDTEDAASEFSTSSYQKATVEDEEGTPATQPQPMPEPQPESSSAAIARATSEKPKELESKYWLSERSTGEFKRTFNFPARVDQDGVTASLKNGVLDLSIPKAQAPAARRIAIQ